VTSLEESLIKALEEEGYKVLTKAQADTLQNLLSFSRVKAPRKKPETRRLMPFEKVKAIAEIKRGNSVSLEKLERMQKLDDNITRVGVELGNKEAREKAVYHAIKNGYRSNKEICANSGVNKGTLNSVIYALIKQKKVQKAGFGVYELASNNQTKSDSTEDDDFKGVERP